MSNKERHYFVLSSPSGGGKTTLLRQLLVGQEDLRLSVSVTTRPSRPEEEEGRDYHFVSPEEFQRRIKTGELIEWEEVHGAHYGTPQETLSENDCDVLFDVDTKGALRLRTLYPNTTLIFIQPPTLEELERRLRARGTEDPAELERRIENFRREMDAKEEFDYVIVNDTVERAVSELREIINKVRKKSCQ